MGEGFSQGPVLFRCPLLQATSMSKAASEWLTLRGQGWEMGATRVCSNWEAVGLAAWLWLTSLPAGRSPQGQTWGQRTLTKPLGSCASALVCEGPPGCLAARAKDTSLPTCAGRVGG